MLSNSKHFSQFAPHHGEKTAGIDMVWRNYVTVTLCVALLRGCLLFVCVSVNLWSLCNCFVAYCRVLLLESGNVKEFDSPTTLLTNRNSQFYSLAKNAGLV